jgi:hypothetical protein
MKLNGFGKHLTVTSAKQPTANRLSSERQYLDIGLLMTVLNLWKAACPQIPVE